MVSPPTIAPCMEVFVLILFVRVMGKGWKCVTFSATGFETLNSEVKYELLSRVSTSYSCF